jgi:hypothetical protein
MTDAAAVKYLFLSPSYRRRNTCFDLKIWILHLKKEIPF